MCVTFTLPAVREASAPEFLYLLEEDGVPAYLDGATGRGLRVGATAAGRCGDDGADGAGQAYGSYSRQLPRGSGRRGQTESGRRPRCDGAGRDLQRLALQDPVLAARYSDPDKHDKFGQDQRIGIRDRMTSS